MSVSASKIDPAAIKYVLGEQTKPKPADGLIRINLGCNQHPQKGYINVDLEDYEGVDVIANLEETWPWPDDHADEIIAYDLVEHLKSPIHTMNEAWRVLKHGGIFDISVPSTDHRGAWQDPTHTSFWNENSFLYYADERDNPQSLRGIYPRQIKCRYRIRQLVTTVPNPFNISWVRAILEARKN